MIDPRRRLARTCGGRSRSRSCVSGVNAAAAEGQGRWPATVAMSVSRKQVLVMFEDAIRKLKDLQRRAQRLDGDHSVPVTELFDEEFMLRHTDFPTIQRLLEASGFVVASSEDLAAIPDDQWDAFIRRRTRFESWDDMTRAAAEAWAKRHL